jgi:hypothetical protein
MTPAERITLWLARVRAAGRAAVLSRLLIAVAGAVAVVVPASRPWDQLDIVPWIAVALLAACVILPDSVAGLLFLLTISGGWLLRATDDIGWDVVVTGIALLTVHLSAAFAAQVPSYAKVEWGAAERWLLPAMAAVILSPVVAVGAALVQGADVPGSLVVTIAALAGVTGAVWFAAGQSMEGRDRARR